MVQSDDCLVHFACLAKTLLKEMHETITFMLVTLPNIYRYICFTHRLSNKLLLIWLLTTPSHLTYVTTLPRNLSL